MKLGAYASVAAFIAHRRALIRERAALNDDNRDRLAAMDEIVATLRPEECGALDSAQAAGSRGMRRYREFAELHLASKLRALGLLAP
jgi:hypothetical protein